MRTAPALLALVLPAALASQQGSKPPSCDPDNGGLKLPRGFCATLFADSLRTPRHITVAPNGDVFVGANGGAGRGRGGQPAQPAPPGSGGVVALRDTDGDGHADVKRAFGQFTATEVRLVGNDLYTETGSHILRYHIRRGALEPEGPPDTIVIGLPPGGHGAKTFVIDKNGALYVNVGSGPPTNSCQQQDRGVESPGIDPCPQLERRAGIWRFDAKKVGQRQADGVHFARGIRNSVAMDIHPADGTLYVMQHGRDQLSGNWPNLYTAQQSAESPGEEMFHVSQGDDYGWPYCYFDMEKQQKLLAPEYGGDGKTVGRCAEKKGNVAVFPGHWAPNGLMFYTGSALPSRYRDGTFVVFHGSWNRAPLPQAGFKVVFQPMARGRASGPYEVFADGFINADGTPTTLGGRPTGIAQGPDGALYLADDARGRIWKITYIGP